MAPVRKRQEGFTLVELLVSTAMALALIGITVSLVTSALSSEPRSSSRSSQIEAGRVMLERITRELRQGCSVTGTGSEITLSWNCETPDGPQVTYSCTAGTCSREEDGQTVQMVSGLDPAQSVFGLDAEPPAPSAYVEILLSFPKQQGVGEAVTLSDGVAMRNFTTESSG